MKCRINNPVLGVPITFLDKYNPNQFEILECHEPACSIDKWKKSNKNFKMYESRQFVYNDIIVQKSYHRLFIKRKDV